MAYNPHELPCIRWEHALSCISAPEHLDHVKAGTQGSHAFLLAYPRRCYTLLFPSGPMWILFGIIFALNFIDILLIIVLDLSNPEVSSLLLSQRIPADCDNRPLPN